MLAPDQRGHGASDPVAFADGFGGPDALAYLRSLPFVERDNIGLEGHSMGGWTVLRAAGAHPDGYRSLILEGSSVGAPSAPEGTTAFPRNLLVVYGTRDEFGGFVWGREAPLATGSVQKLRDLFGSRDPVEPGRLYGRVEDGSARMLLTPEVTHAWLHQSQTGIAPAIGFAVFLAFVGIFGTVSRRVLGSIVPGAVVSGLFVTSVLVATQPIGA